MASEILCYSQRMYYAWGTAKLHWVALRLISVALRTRWDALRVFLYPLIAWTIRHCPLYCLGRRIRRGSRSLFL